MTEMSSLVGSGRRYGLPTYATRRVAFRPLDPIAPIGAAFGDFLPTLFVAYGIWRVTFRFVLPAFEHIPLEREIWTLGFFWIGVLLNVRITRCSHRQLALAGRSFLRSLVRSSPLSRSSLLKCLSAVL